MTLLIALPKPTHSADLRSCELPLTIWHISNTNTRETYKLAESFDGISNDSIYLDMCASFHVMSKVIFDLILTPILHCFLLSFTLA